MATEQTPTATPGAEPSYPAETIAKLLNLDATRVLRLAYEGIIPKPSRLGRRTVYSLVGSVRGYVMYLQERVKKRETRERAADPMRQSRMRLYSIRAEKERLEVDRLAGKVVPASKLEDAVGYVVTLVRSRLLALPRRVALHLFPENPAEAERVLDEYVRTILDELAADESLPEWLEADDSEGPREESVTLETSAEDQRLRVGG